MRSAVVTALVALALTLALAREAAGEAPHRYQGACSPEITNPDSDGLAAEDAALGFVQSILSGDVSNARSQLTSDAKGTTTDAQIGAVIQAIRSRGVSGGPALSSAFVLRFTAPPKAVAFVPCPDQGPHRGMDFVAAGPAAKQAHVAFSTATKGEGVSIYSIWLEVQDGAWRIAGFHFDPSMMARRDGFAWWALAKSQEQEGHALNAWLLYAVAQSLLYRGSIFQPVGLVPLSQEASKLPIVPELQGRPPFDLVLGGRSFKLLSLGVEGVEGGRAILALVQESPDWQTDKDADGLNHQLIDAYAKAHPEWEEVFDLLAARTCEPDLSRCFGTVYERRKGYLTPPG